MTIYKFSVGVVLAVAMVGVLGLSALVFSSRDFQFGVAQISPSTNGLISSAQPDAADRQIQQLEPARAGPRGELLEIDQQIAALDTQVQGAEAITNEARAAMVGAGGSSSLGRCRPVPGACSSGPATPGPSRCGRARPS